ncbi:putative ankyrin repeat-containing domain, PGG domain-containing protein [Rosa chinensis]|uniref:Putative ankyrin repeat-containing domain, PGG domain-containing protein n=1 Tax=Rosa chinensis TaxID=74649 RepID=A0A2P6RKG1_ROSCH|nr:ankyrin repeat-containing protein At5g02620 [Rosa chinensis]PRQ46922.1 putative ankyrin repeat-containing domain, PGG domain-containing protein [Rosa chinensis]
MEKKLSDVAMEGSVKKLNDLIQQDPLVLDRALVSSLSETPLHIASMLGHLDLVKALLSRKPDFATELDSRGSTPLHLAAAKGHVEVLRELIWADSAACLVRNQDGRTALHVAAVKGRVEVVGELVRARTESTRALTDRGESVMHLCVGSHRLEGLRVLVECIGKDDQLVNLKDGNGNTILHIAVAKKQVEIIKYLLTSTGVNVNALNLNGSTALEILLQSPRDLKDMEIENSLREVGAQRAKDMRSIEHGWVPKKEPQITRRVVSSNGKRTMTRRATSVVSTSGEGQTMRHLGSTVSSKESESNKPEVNQKPTEWLGRKRDSLMVVASLLATVAFQAAITPPGGVWQDDLQVDENGNPVDKPHTVGTSIMATNKAEEYGIFMIFNSITFLSSLSIILLLVSGLPIKKRKWMWIQMIIMWIAITTQVSTYFLSLRHLSPKNLEPVLKQVTEISVLTWLCLMSVVFIGNVIRLNLWVLRKYGYIKPQEVDPSATIDEELEEV